MCHLEPSRFPPSMRHGKAEYEKPPQQASQSETRNLLIASRRTHPAAWKYGVVAVRPERDVSLLKCATWRVCRRETFLNEESMSYKRARVRKLLVSRTQNSISDRLWNRPVFCPFSAPCPRVSKDQRWSTFLHNHADSIVACGEDLRFRYSAAPGC
jgi:hypothetical protein